MLLTETDDLRRSCGAGTLKIVSETGWDRELVVTQLGILADLRANTERIVELLEEDDGEEAEED